MPTALFVAACALALPPVLSPDLNLSVFTGSSGTVKLAADAAAFALPLAGLAVPGLAVARRLAVVPSTAAIVSLHEVPG